MVTLKQILLAFYLVSFLVLGSLLGFLIAQPTSVAAFGSSGTGNDNSNWPACFSQGIGPGGFTLTFINDKRKDHIGDNTTNPKYFDAVKACQNYLTDLNDRLGLNPKLKYEQIKDQKGKCFTFNSRTPPSPYEVDCTEAFRRSANHTTEQISIEAYTDNVRGGHPPGAPPVPTTGNAAPTDPAAQQQQNTTATQSGKNQDNKPKQADVVTTDLASVGCKEGETRIATPLEPGGPTCIKDDAAGANNPIFRYMRVIIRFLSAGVGIVIVLMVVIGGIQYITSTGNPQATAAAKNRIVNALGALLLFIFMFAILNFLVPGGLLK